MDEWYFNQLPGVSRPEDIFFAGVLAAWQVHEI